MLPKLNIKAFQILFYSCLGVATEIVFTAGVGIKNQIIAGEITDFSLTGHTYVWMFPIYAFVPFLFSLGYGFLKKYHLVIRLFLYALIIFGIEFLSGAILEMLTGKCPWEYCGPFAIMGYIRLDYTLGWMLFGFILEQFHLFFSRVELNQKVE